MPYGRPMKGASRRVPTTVHLPTGTLDIIDNYIDDHEKNVESGRMSRSDFINEAVNRYLVELGLAESEAASGNTMVTASQFFFFFDAFADGFPQGFQLCSDAFGVVRV